MVVGYVAGHESDPCALRGHKDDVESVVLQRFRSLSHSQVDITVIREVFHKSCILYIYQHPYTNGPFDALLAETVSTRKGINILARIQDNGGVRVYPVDEREVSDKLENELGGPLARLRVGPYINVYSKGIFVKGVQPQVVVMKLS